MKSFIIFNCVVNYVLWCLAKIESIHKIEFSVGKFDRIKVIPSFHLYLNVCDMNELLLIALALSPSGITFQLMTMANFRTLKLKTLMNKKSLSHLPTTSADYYFMQIFQIQSSMLKDILRSLYGNHHSINISTIYLSRILLSKRVSINCRNWG